VGDLRILKELGLDDDKYAEQHLKQIRDLKETKKMLERVGKTNFAWASTPDWAETSDRRSSAHEPERFQWIVDSIGADSLPTFSLDTSETLIELLMKSTPHDDLVERWERRQRTAFAVSIELSALAPTDAWLIYMLYTVRLSLRFCALVLQIPKTTLARRRDEILENLGRALIDYPIIQSITGETTMSESIQGLPQPEGLEWWHEGCHWSYQSLLAIAGEAQSGDANRTLDSLMAEARQQFPTQPKMTWWAKMLQSVTDEYSVDEYLLLTLLSDKQNDYGYENILAFGQVGCVVRASDKVARIRNLEGKEARVSESLEDTYYDLAGYCVIAGMLALGVFKLPQRPR
jgi:hypothetical protein